MRSSPAVLTFFALAFHSFDVSAFFNFANSTRLTVNGSHIITAYPKSLALSTGYGSGTGVVSANSTTPITSTAPSTTSSSIALSTPTVSATSNAQQPLPGAPQSPQQMQSSLIPSPPSPLPASATTHLSTTTTPNTVTAATERNPPNAVQQGNPNGPTEFLPSPGNGQPAPGQGSASSGGDNSVLSLSAGSNIFPVTPIASSRYIISSETLTPGGTVTVEGVPIFLPTTGSSVVIGSSTVPLNLSPAPVQTNGALISALDNPGEPRRSVVVVGNSPVAYEILGSALVIGGSNTLTPGGTVTVNNVPIYLPTTGSAVVIGGSTVPLEPSPVASLPTMTGTPIAIQGQTLFPGGIITVANALVSRPVTGSALIIGGTRTLNPGTTAMVDNVPVVFPTFGSFVALGSSTIPLRPSLGPTAPSITPAPVVVQGHTLSPGGVITVANTPVVLPTSGSSLVVGGSNDVALSGAQTIVLGSQALVISRLSTSSALVINSQVVALGSQAVISGVTFSVPRQGNDVIIDGSSTAGLGSAFVPAIGNAPSITIAGGTTSEGSLPVGGSSRTTVSSGGFTAGLAPLGTVTWKNSLLPIGAGLGCVWAGAWI